jgi:hypothetical protein
MISFRDSKGRLPDTRFLASQACNRISNSAYNIE